MIIRWMIKVLTFLNVMATRWSSPLRTTSATGRRTSTQSPGRPRWPWPLCFWLTWTWLKIKRQLGLQSRIKFHEKCQQEWWSKDPAPNQFKKWHPDLILLSHQGRGGLDLGEQAPELQRGVGVRGAEGRLPGQLDHDLAGRMARAWGGARLHQGRTEVRHGSLC